MKMKKMLKKPSRKCLTLTWMEESSDVVCTMRIDGLDIASDKGGRGGERGNRGRGGRGGRGGVQNWESSRPVF